MSSPRVPLPKTLCASDPFTLTTGRLAGLSTKRMRGPDLRAPTSGVRVCAVTPVSIVEHARCHALVLPRDVVFSHLTAARLHGLPTPTIWPGSSELLDVMRDTTRHPIERRGCRHHQGLQLRATEQVSGVMATSALDTWADVAASWELAHLVAAADVLLRRQIATAAQLRQTAEDRTGARGVRRLREAAFLARDGSASTQESIARIWFHRWNLPEPELNAHIADDTGEWVATGDFVWRAPRVVAEYDGDQHRTNRRQWQQDRERRAILEDLGWRMISVTFLTLNEASRREALRRRLVAALAAGAPLEPGVIGPPRPV